MKYTLISFLALLFFSFIINTSVYTQNSWRFAVMGDTHVGSSDTLAEMIPFLIDDSIDCILFPGDIVEGGLACTGSELTLQLNQWKNILSLIYSKGITVYPIRGNHENDAHNNIVSWNSFFFRKQFIAGKWTQWRN